MIDFRAEWQDAPGVRDAALRQTWCRLAIVVSGNAVTRGVDARVPSLRDGVYGSALPLCQWIVENWWFLFNEAYRLPDRYGSRDLARDANHRPWVQRHSLLAAREGGALPDLCLFRDGSTVVARWMRDGGDATHPHLRFIEEGQVRMAPAEVASGLSRFVECSLDRLRGVDATEVRELRDDWELLKSGLTDEERRICASSARLGINAHYGDELTDSGEALLRSVDGELDAGIRNDLLDAAAIDDLPRDIEWIREARNAASHVGAPGTATDAPTGVPDTEARHAHQTGYRHARALRQASGQTGVIDDMETAMGELGWAAAVSHSRPASPLHAMLEYANNAPVAVAVDAGGPGASDAMDADGRFRLARSMYFHYGRNPSNPPEGRLVTSAYTFEQRASRAFAAEFLAPASALSKRVPRELSHRGVRDLAEEFGVSPLVIAHQVDNHGIASIERI